MRRPPRHWTSLAPCAAAVLLAACGSVPRPGAPVAQSAPARAGEARPRQAAPLLPPAKSGRGGYYQDDGPGDLIPDGLLDTPDAEPKIEPYLARANQPYVVFGKTYVPITDGRPLKERGTGSWYGRKFHGQRTSSGEIYDMFKMTAAHPTLPIPSYARVTHLANGNQVIVRINDRGPFFSGRIIDLSYTAALKLGYLGKGSGELEVERLLPDEIERLAKNKGEPGAAPVLQTAGLALPRAAVERVASDSAPAAIDAAERSAILEMFGQDGPAAQPEAVASGPYLQFGVFAQATNAEAARAELLRIAVADLPPIQVVQAGGLYRVYSGPFATRAEAAGAAQRWSGNGAGKPLIVQR